MPRQAKRNGNKEAPAFLGSTAGNADFGVQVTSDGPVNRLSAASLARPLEMPHGEYRKLAIIIAIAVAISAALIVAYNFTVMGDAEKTRAQVMEVINRGVELELPKLEDYAGLKNDEMFETFKKNGYTIFDNSNDEDRNVDGFDVFKLASDVDPETAGEAYAEGIENLKPIDAARYLAGSWRFLVARAATTEMRLRYADFEATDPTSAIQRAIGAQGFDDAKLEDVAEDTMGNTNLSGTFKKGKTTYEYTVSACGLSQVYDIDGAPADAQFVGIRVTEAS